MIRGVERVKKVGLPKICPIFLFIRQNQLFTSNAFNLFPQPQSQLIFLSSLAGAN